MAEQTAQVRAARVLVELGVATLASQWKGCDAVWPVLEVMADEGAVVVVKLDGQRTERDDTGRYTVVISGGPLGEDFFRTDDHVLEEAMAKGILFYAEKCWRRR